MKISKAGMAIATLAAALFAVGCQTTASESDNGSTDMSVNGCSGKTGTTAKDRVSCKSGNSCNGKQ